MYTTKANNKFKNDLFPQFDKVFNELFNTSFDHIIDEKKNNFTQPSANVIEYKDRFSISIAIPGFTKDDVNIKLEKNMLSISSEREATSEKKFKMKEFSYGKFSRKFKLPNSIDSSSIQAELNNGILEILLQKREEEIDNGPKEITIK